MNDFDGMNKAFSKVWGFRNAFGGWWPTPNLLDSARYAFIESGEALDAYIKLTRPEHVRNRPHAKADLAAELGDVFVMGATTVGWLKSRHAEGRPFDKRVAQPVDWVSIDGMCSWVSKAYSILSRSADAFTGDDDPGEFVARINLSNWQIAMNITWELIGQLGDVSPGTQVAHNLRRYFYRYYCDPVSGHTLAWVMNRGLNIVTFRTSDGAGETFSGFEQRIMGILDLPALGHEDVYAIVSGRAEKSARAVGVTGG